MSAAPAPPTSLAHLLDARREEIVARWAARVRAQDRTEPADPPLLVDSLPRFLEALGRALREGPRPSTDAMARIAAAHGQQRQRVGTDLGAVLREYQALHAVLFELVAEAGYAPTLDEVRVLSEALSVSVAEAVAHFTRDRQAELHRADAALRETGDRLRAILDTAVDGIITIDTRGTILDTNPATTRLFGHAPEEMRGRNVRMLMPEPYASEHDGYLERYQRTHVPHIIGSGREVRGLRKDGSVFPMDLAVSETRLPDGTVSYTGIVRDISARKRAEDARNFLLEAGQRLSEALDLESTLRTLADLAVAHLGDYCFVDVVRADGQLDRVVRSARDPALRPVLERAMKYPPVVGSDSPLARAFERNETVAATVTPDFLDRVSRDAEHRAVLAELDPRSLASVPLVARGRKLGIVNLASRDPQRMTHPEVLRVTRAMADRAALALDNARLLREAQEAARLREQVLAIVSHDLRSPLQAIALSATTLLRRPEADAVTLKVAARIAAASERATHLIADLLDFSRARQGPLPVQPVPTDVQALATRVVEEVRIAHPDRDLELVLDDGGPTPVDPVRLAQVISNLVGNAVQYSPDHTPVRVAVRGGADEVVLEVHNQGTPIPPEALPVLFEPFQRGQADADERRGNLGLGLYITQQIVLAHGGRIDVTSTAKDGTTFTVHLPRKLPAGP